MLFGDLIDVFEEELHRRNKRLLDILLFERTSRRNIIWATDSYADLGDGYAATDEMRPELNTGENKYLIRPRILKSEESQDIVKMMY